MVRGYHILFCPFQARARCKMCPPKRVKGAVALPLAAQTKPRNLTSGMAFAPSNPSPQQKTPWHPVAKVYDANRGATFAAGERAWIDKEDSPCSTNQAKW